MPNSDRRYAFILNPQSGNGRAGQQWAELETKVREEVGELDVFLTGHPGHATELAAQALDEGYTRIVSCGGDGTHFEIVNGFFRGGQPINPAAELALFPLGTGSDLPRTLRIPRDAEAAIPFLTSESVVASDIGRLTSIDEATGEPRSCYFLTACHIGFGGAVNEYVNTHSKALGGRITFFIALLAVGATFRPVRMRIECDGESFEEELIEIFAANGQFDGGGMKVGPYAKLNSGEFEIYTIPKMGIVSSLLNVPRLYRGTQDEHPDVRRFQGKKLTVDADERILATPDGEVAGCLPATIEIVPQAVRLVTGPNPPVV